MDLLYSDFSVKEREDEMFYYESEERMEDITDEDAEEDEDLVLNQLKKIFPDPIKDNNHKSYSGVSSSTGTSSKKVVSFLNAPKTSLQKPKTVPLSTPTVTKKKAPEPSDLTLATMTMTGNINKLINLEVITKYVNLNNYLDGIKCEGVGNRGQVPPTKSKKKNKDPVPGKRQNKNRLKKDFFNQCTIYVYPFGTEDKRQIKKNPLNAKLFNNGQIVLTGVKEEIEAHATIKEIINALNSTPEGEITYKTFSEHKSEFKEKEFENYLKSNITHLKKLLAYVHTKGVNYLDQLRKVNLEDILNECITTNLENSKSGKQKKKWDEERRERENKDSGIIEEEPVPIIKLLTPEIDHEIMILIKFYQILTIYVSQDDFLTIFESTLKNVDKVGELLHRDSLFYMKFMEELVDPILEKYDKSRNELTLILPPFVRREVNDNIHYNSNKTRIDMINSFFYTNFQIDRAKIQQILVNKYKLSADYEPDVYQGVNAKYLSRVVCDQTQHKLCICKNKKNCKCICKCKEISIFIFRKGTVIITGAKAWKQVLDAYENIQKILIQEYTDICLEPIPKKIRKDALPDKVVMEGNIWLRKSFIRKNPKNFFLIREFDIKHLNFQ